MEGYFLGRNLPMNWLYTSNTATVFFFAYRDGPTRFKNSIAMSFRSLVTMTMLMLFIAWWFLLYSVMALKQCGHSVSKNIKKVLFPGVRFFGVYSAPLSMRTNLKSGIDLICAEVAALKNKNANSKYFIARIFHRMYNKKFDSENSFRN